MSRALNHHMRAAAMAAVGRAYTRGELPRPTACEACDAPNTAEGRTRIVRHHYDYSKPFDVIPLCHSCHARVHRGSIPEPRTGRMYPKKAKKPQKQKPTDGLVCFVCPLDISGLLEDHATSQGRARREQIIHYVKQGLMRDGVLAAPAIPSSPVLRLLQGGTL